jgi:hypothetical protein
MAAEKAQKKTPKRDEKGEIMLEGQEVVKGPRLLPKVEEADDE